MTSSHSAASLSPRSTRLVQFGLAFLVRQFQTIGQVLADGHRQDHRAGKDHPDPAAQGDHIRFRVEDIFAVEQDLPGNRFDLGQVVQAVEAAQQGGFAAAGRSEQHRDGVGRDIQVDVAQGFGAVRILQAEGVRMTILFIGIPVYHCLFALARERMTVAIRFMPSTKMISTSAVPYWIWIGIPGTWVEMTNRW